MFPKWKIHSYHLLVLCETFLGKSWWCQDLAKLKSANLRDPLDFFYNATGKVNHHHGVATQLQNSNYFRVKMVKSLSAEVSFFMLFIVTNYGWNGIFIFSCNVSLLIGGSSTIFQWRTFTGSTRMCLLLNNSFFPLKYKLK